MFVLVKMGECTAAQAVPSSWRHRQRTTASHGRSVPVHASAYALDSRESGDRGAPRWRRVGTLHHEHLINNFCSFTNLQGDRSGALLQGAPSLRVVAIITHSSITRPQCTQHRSKHEIRKWIKWICWSVHWYTAAVWCCCALMMATTRRDGLSGSVLSHFHPNKQNLFPNFSVLF